MLIAILFLGLLLRVISLNQSFWLDEATSAQVVKNFSLEEIFTKFLPGDFHPPLYYVFLKWWSTIFGVSEVSLRSMSIFFGLLTIVVIYKLAQMLFNDRKTAILSTLLLSTSGLHIYYSQEARMYALAAFFVAACVYYFTKVYFGKAQIGEWAIFSLLLALIFLTDYLAIVVLVVFWLYVLVFKKGRGWLMAFIVAHIPLIAMFALWFKHLSAQFAVGLHTKVVNPMWWDILGQANLKNVALVWVKFILGRISFVDKNLYIVLVIFVSAVFLLPMLYPLLRGKIGKMKQYFLIACWLCVPIVAATLISFKIPVLSYFRLLFVLPAFYLLIAWGTTLLTSYKIQVIVLLVTINLTSSFYYLFNTKMHREDWRGFARYVEENSHNRSRVVFPSLNNHEGFVYYGGADNVSGNLVQFSNYQTVWLVRYLTTFYSGSDKLKVSVEEIGFTRTKELDFNGIVVWQYER